MLELVKCTIKLKHHIRPAVGNGHFPLRIIYGDILKSWSRNECKHDLIVVPSRDMYEVVRKVLKLTLIILANQLYSDKSVSSLTDLKVTVQRTYPKPSRSGC